ncbi:MAG: hypothetical protein HZA66_03380 [Rhodopseudomonas palustris]|uniref:Uncharacterized protein n=1 Tax=Rhodopseudomonas palustris TaxID=1076 RepID=A0A933RUI4_RHOPL|nr:hypothetical protein [Rhodopseudomonas palustris]
MSRTSGRKEGETFVSILKTAEALRSDPDFVGLMFRCDPKGKIDLILVVVSPLPPRSRPSVTLAVGETAVSLEGTILAGGAGINLSDGAQTLVARDWQTAPPLSVAVKGETGSINGFVDMRGFSRAYRDLLDSCPR